MESDTTDAPLEDIEKPIQSETADATTNAELAAAGSAGEIHPEGQQQQAAAQQDTPYEPLDEEAAVAHNAAAGAESLPPAPAAESPAEATASNALATEADQPSATAPATAAGSSSTVPGTAADAAAAAQPSTAGPGGPGVGSAAPSRGPGSPDVGNLVSSRPCSSLPPPATGDSDAPVVTYFEEGVRAIDVEVDCGPGVPCRMVHVVIDVAAITAKPYLGGYRHKSSGEVFHHACTQTAPQQPTAAAPKQQQKLCRTTQTVSIAASSCQTMREAGTQMARPGLLVDESGDRLMTPRPYYTSLQLDMDRWNATLTIQRYTRGWMARHRARILRGHKSEREEFLEGQAADQEEAAETRRRQDLARRLQPLAPGDFRLLTGELDTWRKQERGKIKAAGLEPEQEQAALQLLLAKETRLLQTIDKLRVGARAVAKEKHADRMLTGMAAPVTWELRNGATVEVHTPATVRAQELQQLYRGLNLTQLTVDERLDVLLHVKWTVKEFDCQLTHELVQLIDREADLVNRGRTPSTLEGLRKRISSLFLTFCTTPAFNPEAARFQVRPAGVPTAVVAQPEDETFVFLLEDVKVTAGSSGRLGSTVAAY